jgi:hypothetical protein
MRLWPQCHCPSEATPPGGKSPATLSGKGTEAPLAALLLGYSPIGGCALVAPCDRGLCAFASLHLVLG